MNTYETKIPRITMGLAALALTALTLGIGVALPVTTGTGERALQSASMTGAPADAPTAVSPVRYIESIEVVAVRDRNVSAAQETSVQRKRRTQG